MKFYLQYLGYKEWQEVTPDLSKVEIRGYNRDMYYNNALLHEADTDDKYLFMRFPHTIHFLPETAKIVYGR